MKIDEGILKSLTDLYKNTNKSDELEVIFSSEYVSLEKYITLMKYLNHKAKVSKLLIEETNILDISYTVHGDAKDLTVYRVSVSELKNINKYIDQFIGYNNHVVFGTLLKMLDKDKSLGNVLSAMKKTKEGENTVELSDYGLRVRKSYEEDLTKEEVKSLVKIDYTVAQNIYFRLKQRMSLYLMGDEKGDHLKIDLTSVRSSKNIKFLANAIPTYELELEFSYLNEKFKKQVDIQKILNEAELLIKILQQTNFVIRKSEEKMVIQEYIKIAIDSKDSGIQKLDARKPESLELQYLTDVIPNKYAVTDKADGDRYFLIIVDLVVYLISNNMKVKYTGIILDKKLEKYNGTILDGEYIFLPKKNRHIYMVFDCLFNGTNDVRRTESLMQRLKNADEIVNACFIFGKQTGFIMNDYEAKDTEFNLEKRVAFYGVQIKKNMDALNHDIDIEKKMPLIRRKYFIAVSGAKPWEISKYSSLLWNRYTNDKEVNCPYILDGLVYQPLQQDYETKKAKSKLADYKWKPPNKNSIDFYIEFVKDKMTNKIMSVYDNSIVIDDFVAEKPYNIINLFVGSRNSYSDRVEPVLFREKENGYICNIYTDKEKAYDIEGNVLNNNTIVEFYYNDDKDVDPRFKWVPIRTRYDKTEQMLKYQSEFGNYTTIADKAWRSIINPILIGDFDDLAKGGDTYDKKLMVLKSKISAELIIGANKENRYFQVIDTYVKPMRSFHNWIKSNIMYTYNNLFYTGGKGVKVIDFAAGKGADINKYYYTNIAFLVALDIDQDSLISVLNGAKSRYTSLRKRKPGVPRMYFIHADCTILLNMTDQNRALKGMTTDNKYFFEKFFNEENRTVFDRVNIQFALHYMLKNEESWGNFKQNLNDYLEPGGLFLVTCSDASLIMKLLENKEKYTAYFTNKEGEKKILYEIVKKYDEKNMSKNKLGDTISFFGSWIFSEGNSMDEYLVDKDFLVKDLLDDCDLELVDTDTFENMMENNRTFLANSAKVESKEETRKFFSDVYQYYNKNDPINAACYAHSFTFRYYVFRRKQNSKVGKIIKRQKGGGYVNIDVLDESEFKIAKLKTSEHSFHDSIHHILKNHKLIPESINSDQFYKEYKDIDKDKNITLYHDDGKTKKKILDGLKIFIAEHDCNGKIDYVKYDNGENDVNNAIILYKQASKHTPVYRIEAGGRRAVFKIDDELILAIEKSI